MAISSLGVGSGLDLNALVQQLVNAERAPKVNRLNQREARLQAQLSAFGTLKSGLASLETALGKLANLQLGRTATVSDGAKLTATADATADPGSYNIAVNRLATPQTLASLGFEDADAVVGTGRLVLQVGAGETFEISIEEPNNTLRGVRDAINAAGAGVQASIVNDGSGARLVLTARETGAVNTIAVAVQDNDGHDADLMGLSRLTSAHLEETVAAQDAQLTINGLPVESASNSLESTIEGLTLTLKAETEAGSVVEVTVGRDLAAITGAVNELIRTYNAVVGQTNNLTRFDPETREASLLVGDATVRGVRTRLGSALFLSGGTEDSTLRYLVNLGIRSDDTGRLILDENALNAALDTDVDAVVALLNDVGGAFQDLVGSMSGAGGLLDSRADGIRGSLRGVEQQREVLAQRLDQYEARLVRQFSALDALVAQMQSTSSYLASQLDALANLLPGRSR